MSTDQTTSEDAEVDMAGDVLKVMKTITVMGSKVSKTVAVDFLKGKKNNSIFDRHTRDPVYGSGKSKTKEFWTALIRELVSKKLLKEIKQSSASNHGFKKTFSWSSLTTTDKGDAWIKDPQRKLMVYQVGDLKSKTTEKSILQLEAQLHQDISLQENDKENDKDETQNEDVHEIQNEDEVVAEGAALLLKPRGKFDRKI